MVSTKLEWPEDIQEQSSIKKLLYKKCYEKIHKLQKKMSLSESLLVKFLA